MLFGPSANTIIAFYFKIVLINLVTLSIIIKGDVMICEKCNKEHNGAYGSGRFCSPFCARSFSTQNMSIESKRRRNATLKSGRRKTTNIKLKVKKETKKTLAEFPYNNYYIYKIHHKKENRNYAVLISVENPKQRTTISYARYLMSIKLGRFLEKWEQVDHIDNDKTNDTIENLQILTTRENNVKQGKYKGTQMVLLKCPVCMIEFSKPKRKTTIFTHHTKFTCCSRECAYTLAKLKNDINWRDKLLIAQKENVIKEYIQH